MKNLRRFVALLLVSVMALCVLTGCGGGGGATNKVDRSIATKLGADKDIIEKEGLNDIARATLDYTQNLVNCGSDTKRAEEVTRKYIIDVQNAMIKMNGVVSKYSVAVGAGEDRDGAIAMLEKDFSTSGKGEKYCGMAEGVVKSSIDSKYVIVVIFGH